MKNFGRNYIRFLPKCRLPMRLGWGVVLCLALWTPAFAEQVATEQSKTDIEESHPLADKHAVWIFSGSVVAETGELYEYFVEIKRHDNQVQALMTLWDVQSKSVIFSEDSHMALTAETAMDDWRIGAMFIRYNVINHSWILGIDRGEQVGFNFKVDMLNQAHQPPLAQQWRSGIHVTIAQTGLVNGAVLLKADTPTQFVTGKSAWFRQVVFSQVLAKMPELQGVVCHFDDGSQLYAIQLVEADAIRESLSGLYNMAGTAMAVSQFIRIDHGASGIWKIQIPYPKLQLELAEPVQYQSVVMGYMANKEKLGFCMINKA